VRRTITALSGALLAASLALPVAATPPGDGGGALEDGHKVTICHRTSSSDPVNGWVIISVDISSAGGLRTLANHLHHTDDLNNRGRSDYIPAYEYEGASFGPYFDEGSPTPDADCEGDEEEPPSS
jgi:hypothetical protein